MGNCVLTAQLQRNPAAVLEMQHGGPGGIRQAVVLVLSGLSPDWYCYKTRHGFGRYYAQGDDILQSMSLRPCWHDLARIGHPPCDLTSHSLLAGVF